MEEGGMRGPRSRRTLRGLIRLLPFDFRTDFGDEIEAAFEEQQSDARQQGGRGRSAWLWLLTAVDTVRLALAQHWDLLRQDLRFGVRTFVRNPGFTSVVVLTLALGTGAVTAIFTVVDAVVFRPLPLPQSDRLVHLEVVRHERGGFAGGMPVFSFPQFEDVRDQNHVFTGVAAYAGDGGVTAAGSDAKIEIGHASSNLFRILGVRPELGRGLTPADESGRGPLVAGITHRTWTSVYSLDPRILGRVLTEARTGNGSAQPVIIVGVLPSGFRFPFYNGDTDIDAWLLTTPDMRFPEGAVSRGSARWSVVARLKPGVSLEAASKDLDNIAARLAIAYPEYHAHSGLRAMSFHDHVVGSDRLPLLLFLAAVASLLLIACANVTNLLLARGSTREREFAMRMALGAGRMRVVRQMLTESSLLAVAGGMAGLGRAFAGVRAFVAFSPSMPRLEQAGIDHRVLAFSFALMVFTSVVAGFVPVIRCSRRSVVEALTRAGGGTTAMGGRRRFRPVDLLVVAQVTLALALLVGAGLMVTSFTRLIGADLGFEWRSLVTADVTGTLSPQESNRTPTWAEIFQQERTTGVVTLTDRQRRRAAVNEEMVRRIAALPGVESVGIGTNVPFPNGRSRNGIRIDAAAATGTAHLLAETASATPGYFKTLKIQLVSGRLFDDRDREGAPRVAIVSETLARLCWPGRDPLGRLVAIGSAPPGRVVGVVRDSLRQGPTDEPAPDLYFPYAQDPQSSKLLLRARNVSPALRTAIGREVNQADAGLHVGQLRVVEDLLWERLVVPRFITFLVTTFGAFALLLALIGVHGVLAYSVSRRGHEIGIRMALGGSHGRVMRMVLAEATRYAVIGGITGLAAGIAVAQVARSLLFRVAPTDPTTLVAVSLVMLVTVLVAALGPARRATRIDPIACLRQD